MQAENTPPGYCGCGCGKPTALSERTGEPNIYVHGHNSRPSPIDWIEDDNGCWIWQRSYDVGGTRPRMKVNGKWCRAYRVIYEQRVGPIPDGLELDHLCRNPACVNPEHLEPVTTEENRRRAGGAFLPRLPLADRHRLVAAPKSELRALAAEYGVPMTYISSVRSRAKRRRLPEVASA